MSIENQQDWNGLREVGRVVRAVLNAMQRRVQPGITTADLNAIGAEELHRHSARSAPILVQNCQGSLKLINVPGSVLMQMTVSDTVDDLQILTAG